MVQPGEERAWGKVVLGDLPPDCEDLGATIRKDLEDRGIEVTTVEELQDREGLERTLGAQTLGRFDAYLAVLSYYPPTSDGSRTTGLRTELASAEEVGATPLVFLANGPNFTRPDDPEHRAHAHDLRGWASSKFESYEFNSTNSLLQQVELALTDHLPEGDRSYTTGSGDRREIPRVEGFAPKPTQTTTVGSSAYNDQATAEDLLGFAPYVEGMARFLEHDDTEPPLTISIEGPWGSGKTSFLLQLEKRLKQGPPEPTPDPGTGKQDGPEGEDEGGEPITVHFNPWRHEEGETLWAAFALTFLQEVKDALSPWERLKGGSKLLWHRAQWGSNWLEGVRLSLGAAIFMGVVLLAVLAPFAWGPTAYEFARDQLGAGGLSGGVLGATGGIAYLLAVVSGLQWAWSKWLNPFEANLERYIDAPDYEGRVSFIEKFHEDFQKIVESYTGDQPVYVFIDDLDRCEVPRAADLMSAVNLMIADEPQVFFVLAMDREKVAAGVAAGNEEVLPYLRSTRPPGKGEGSREGDHHERGLEFGYQFVEKFVQIPFQIPSPDRSKLGDMLETLDGGAANPLGQGDPTDGEQTEPAADPGPTQEQGEERETDSVRPEALSSRETDAERLRRLDIELSDDSPRVREIALAVAPALDHNPRKLKQFLNLFRLRTYLAHTTGLFDEVRGDDDVQEALTLEQLGKFVAIGIRWPRLMRDVQREDGLLVELERNALKRVHGPVASETLEHLPKPPETAYSQTIKRWTAEDRLLDLLATGLDPHRDLDPETIQRWSLGLLPVEKILSVVPPVEREAAYIRTEEEEEGRGAFGRGRVDLEAKLTPEMVKDKVEAAPGVYVLLDPDSAEASYVGQASNLRSRLLDWVDEAGAVQVEYKEDPVARYEEQARLFHRYGGTKSLKNELHPSHPGLDCPFCSYGQARAWSENVVGLVSDGLRRLTDTSTEVGALIVQCEGVYVQFAVNPEEENWIMEAVSNESLGDEVLSREQMDRLRELGFSKEDSPNFRRDLGRPGQDQIREVCDLALSILTEVYGKDPNEDLEITDISP